MRQTTSSLAVAVLAAIAIGTPGWSADAQEASARNNATAYIGAGGEIGMRRVRVRLEARDYIGGFRSFDGTGATVGRNDVVVMVGLRRVIQ